MRLKMSLAPLKLTSTVSSAARHGLSRGGAVITLHSHRTRMYRHHQRRCFSSSTPVDAAMIIFERLVCCNETLKTLTVGSSSGQRRTLSGGPKKSKRSSSEKLENIWERFALMTLTCGSAFLVWNYWQLRKIFSEMIYPPDKRKSMYIYPFDPGEAEFFVKKHCYRWLPSPLVTTQAAWELFEQISRGGSNREIAIEKLASMDNLLDSECLYFAMNLDLPTSIALAYSGADPRLFPPPATCQGPQESFTQYFGTTFRRILEHLPPDNIHYNLNYILQTSFKTFCPSEEEKLHHDLDLYTGFTEAPTLESVPTEMSESRFLKVCLQATISHTRDLAAIKLIPRTELLDALVIIYQRYLDNPEIMSLLLKVLANLSCDTSCASEIKNSGLLRVLTECARSSDVRLVLPAKRALHNLERESNDNLLLSGIYQLYPDFRTDQTVFEFDIIFIHGILGGVFRTWRQQDKLAKLEDVPENQPQKQNKGPVQRWVGEKSGIASKYVFKTPVENPEEENRHKSRKILEDGTLEYSDKEIDLETEKIDCPNTQCWPREWLPMDIPNSRIIAVDFDSFVTHWSGYCPVETTKTTLKDRAEELLHKLEVAGVGDRPIIWVTHSMGGLLAKSMLCQAAVSSNKKHQNLCKKTKGIVFCSVPHQGSYIALANTTRRYIFMPTYEALELTNSDSSLTLLHERFKRLWRAFNFKVLSFGEELGTKGPYKISFKMVPFSSADPGMGDFYRVKLNHLNTCKPNSRGSFIYQKIVEMVHKIADETRMEGDQ